MRNIWDMLALVVLIAGALACAWLWFGRARQARIAQRGLMAVLGVAVFVALFFGITAYIDAPGRMPRWFLHFINEYPDALGACLLMVGAFAINMAILFVASREMILNFISERVLGLPKSY